jgi:hypothetical protein
VVVADNKKAYYVEGLASWDTKLLGKKVKVTGMLLIETYRDHKNDTVQEQEIVDTKRTIKMPTWTLIE